SEAARVDRRDRDWVPGRRRVHDRPAQGVAAGRKPVLQRGADAEPLLGSEIAAALVERGAVREEPRPVRVAELQPQPRPTDGPLDDDDALERDRLAGLDAAGLAAAPDARARHPGAKTRRDRHLALAAADRPAG